MWILFQCHPEIQTWLKQHPETQDEPYKVVDQADALTILLETAADQVTCVVLGPAVTQALALVQHVYTFAPKLPVAVLRLTDELAAFEQSLNLTPLLGRYVRCFDLAHGVGFIDQLLQVVQTAKQHTLHQQQLEAVNTQLAAIETPVHSQIYLDTLLNHAPIGIVLLDQEYTIRSWNRAAARLTHTAEFAVLGLPVQQIFPHISLQQLRQAAQSAAAPFLTSRVVDHTPCWFEVTVAVLNAATTTTLLLFSDVTTRVQATQAREQTQRRLAFLSDLSLILIQSTDHETTLKHMAAAMVPFLADWCVISVIHPDQDLQRIAFAAHDLQQQAALQQLCDAYPLTWDSLYPGAEAIRRGQPLQVKAQEHPAFKPHPSDSVYNQLINRLAPQHVLALPLVFGDHLLGALSLVRTTSNHEYTQEDRLIAVEAAQQAAFVLEHARLYAEAQKAIQLRDQFLSVASHELRTPISVLAGSTQLLQRYLKDVADPSGRITKRLSALEGQVNRLQRLTGTLLDLSRLEAGQLELELEAFDLAALLTQLVDELQPLVHKHTFITDGLEAACWIEGDALRIEQALHNIINNAIKYSPQGEQIHLQFACSATHATIKVRDSGIGIPAHDLARIFERFYRARNVTAARLHGLGIGLSVVREIITLHGGTIDLDSTEGAGTTVTVCLPLNLPHDS